MKLAVQLIVCSFLICSCGGSGKVNVDKLDIAGIQLDMPMNEAMILAWDAVGGEAPKSKRKAKKLETSKLSDLLCPTTTREKYADFREGQIEQFTASKEGVTVILNAVHNGKDDHAKVYSIKYSLQDKGNSATATEMGKKALKKYGKPTYGEERNGRYYYGWCSQPKESGGCTLKTGSLKISNQELVLEDQGLYEEYQKQSNKKNAGKANF